MQDAKKVALIDDDPNIIEIYGTKLKNENYTVVTAPNGEVGIELIKNEKPDLILLDIIMPKKNGLEVLETLQTDPETSRIPVVILSNVSDGDTVKKVSNFTTHFYVVKSLTTPQKLASIVKEVLYGEK